MASTASVPSASRSGGSAASRRAHAERATAAVRSAAAGEQGELRVGFLSSVANYMMPPVVRAFSARDPGGTLATQEIPIARLVAGLRDGDLDAALTRPPLVDDLEPEVVLTEPVAAVLHEDHPLAGRADLELAELAHEPWVLTPRSSWPPWHRHFDEVFARAGFDLQIVHHGTSAQNLLALVAAGVGVTRLPLSARSLRDSGIAFVPLAGDQAYVVLARHAEAVTPPLAPFATVVRQVAHELNPLTAG
jgi:DNA-binding transcriptional LysR family regulator